MSKKILVLIFTVLVALVVTQEPVSDCWNTTLEDKCDVQKVIFQKFADQDVICALFKIGDNGNCQIADNDGLINLYNETVDQIVESCNAYAIEEALKTSYGLECNSENEEISLELIDIDTLFFSKAAEVCKKIAEVIKCHFQVVSLTPEIQNNYVEPVEVSPEIYENETRRLQELNNIDGYTCRINEDEAAIYYNSFKEFSELLEEREQKIAFACENKEYVDENEITICKQEPKTTGRNNGLCNSNKRIINKECNERKEKDSNIILTDCRDQIIQDLAVKKIDEKTNKSKNEKKSKAKERVKINIKSTLQTKKNEKKEKVKEKIQKEKEEKNKSEIRKSDNKKEIEEKKTQKENKNSVENKNIKENKENNENKEKPSNDKSDKSNKNKSSDRNSDVKAKEGGSKQTKISNVDEDIKDDNEENDENEEDDNDENEEDDNEENEEDDNEEDENNEDDNEDDNEETDEQDDEDDNEENDEDNDEEDEEDDNEMNNEDNSSNRLLQEESTPEISYSDVLSSTLGSNTKEYNVLVGALDHLSSLLLESPTEDQINRIVDLKALIETNGAITNRHKNDDYSCILKDNKAKFEIREFVDAGCTSEDFSYIEITKESLKGSQISSEVRNIEIYDPNYKNVFLQAMCVNGVLLIRKEKVFDEFKKVSLYVKGTYEGEKVEFDYMFAMRSRMMTCYEMSRQSDLEKFKTECPSLGELTPEQLKNMYNLIPKNRKTDLFCANSKEGKLDIIKKALPKMPFIPANLEDFTLIIKCVFNNGKCEFNQESNQNRNLRILQSDSYYTAKDISSEPGVAQINDPNDSQVVVAGATPSQRSSSTEVVSVIAEAEIRREEGVFTLESVTKNQETIDTSVTINPTENSSFLLRTANYLFSIIALIILI